MCMPLLMARSNSLVITFLGQIYALSGFIQWANRGVVPNVLGCRNTYVFQNYITITFAILIQSWCCYKYCVDCIPPQIQHYWNWLIREGFLIFCCIIVIQGYAGEKCFYELRTPHGGCSKLLEDKFFKELKAEHPEMQEKDIQEYVKTEIATIVDYTNTIFWFGIFGLICVCGYVGLKVWRWLKYIYYKKQLVDYRMEVYMNIQRRETLEKAIAEVTRGVKVRDIANLILEFMGEELEVWEPTASVAPSVDFFLCCGWYQASEEALPEEERPLLPAAPDYGTNPRDTVIGIVGIN